MSYDLNVLIIGQDKPSLITLNSSIEIINEREQTLRYHDTWLYMKKTRGIWYCLGKYDDGIFNALPILEADFEADSNKLPIPDWIDDELKSNYKPMIVVKEYKEELFKIIKFMIEQSPIKTIMLLSRFQCYDQEIIYGVLNVNKFIELCCDGKILFNVCYLIRKD